MFDFNKASEDDLKREYKRIAAQSGDDGFGTKKELKHLSQMLMDREQVLAFSSGFMDGNTWLIVSCLSVTLRLWGCMFSICSE